MRICTFQKEEDRVDENRTSIQIDVRPRGWWRKLLWKLGFIADDSHKEAVMQALNLCKVSVQGYDDPWYGYAFFEGVRQDGTPIRGDLVPAEKGVYAIVEK